MALGPIQSSFMNPLGLLALLSILPLVILYLLKPDPRRYALPTMEFLAEQTGKTQNNSLWQRFNQNLLFLIQLLVLILIALALAGPLAALPQPEAPGDTVIVLDTSASMATETQDGTRLSRAITTATSELSDPVTIITTSPSPTIAIEATSPPIARDTLNGITVSHTAGDLAGSIQRATTTLDDPGRIVVLSDFAGTTEWQTAVEHARIDGHKVHLAQFDTGGTDNVGIIDLSFRGRNATATLLNTGSTPQSRTVTLAEQTSQVTLAPGDTAVVTMTIPPGGGELQLTPPDSFTLDDTAYLTAPDDPQIDVLVLTNDENTYLTTALSLLNDVSLTIDNPPVSGATGYDVVVFSNIDPERILQGTIEDARTSVTQGAGAIVLAQPDINAIPYGELLLLEPDVIGGQTNVHATTNHQIIRGIELIPAQARITGTLRNGTVLAVDDTGSPFIAIHDRSPGRVVYYGYLENASEFKFHYQYPVFWRNTVYFAAGHEQPPDLHYATGTTLRFNTETTVTTPRGTVQATTVDLDYTGYYDTPTGEIAVNLLSTRESNLIPNINPDETTQPEPQTSTAQTVLSPFITILIIALIITELWYLKYRGDI